MRSFIFFVVMVWFFPFPSEARVFDFKEKNLSAVLDGAFGLSLMGQEGFAANKGSNVALSESLDYMQSGRIGFGYNAHEFLNLLFVLEVLKPMSIKGASGTNLSGTELYTFSSSALILNPSVFIEYSYSKMGNVRYFIFLGAGMAQLTMDNQYEINSTGESELGVSSYTEKLKGTSTNGSLGFGLEAHFVDTATFSLYSGYRIFQVKELKHSSTVTTYAEGDVAEGDTVYNGDGSKRTMDLSGPYVGMGFRFYIP